MQKNNKLQTRAIQTLTLSTALLLVAGCQPATVHTDTAQSLVKFSPPARIVQTRAVNQEQLEPVVKLANGVQIPMQVTSDQQWSGTIRVRPNEQYTVTVEWIETLSDGDLVLATWSDTVSVSADGASVTLSEEDYDFNIDSDGDNVNNLQERQNDTNPFVHNDTGAIADGSNSATTDAGEEQPVENEGNGTDGSATNNENTTETNNNDTPSAENPAPTTDNEDPNSTEVVDDGTSNNETDESGPDNTDTDATNTETPQIQPASVLIPRITPQNAPQIDGLGAQLNNQDLLSGEWANAVQFDNAGAGLWIKNLMIDQGADSENGAELRRWAAMHDGEFLYVLVLSDDTGARHSDSTNMWEDDTVELFIDGNNSKNTTYGDADDFQFLIPLQQQNSTTANNEITGRYSIGPNSSDATVNIEFFTGPGIGPDGIRIKKWEQDVYEIAVPISQAGITPGTPFGFEVQLNDDDNGENRESKWGWFHPAKEGDEPLDLTYMNPSIMGTVVLQQ